MTVARGRKPSPAWPSPLPLTPPWECPRGHSHGVPRPQAPSRGKQQGRGTSGLWWRAGSAAGPSPGTGLGGSAAAARGSAAGCARFPRSLPAPSRKPGPFPLASAQPESTRPARPPQPGAVAGPPTTGASSPCPSAGRSIPPALHSQETPVRYLPDKLALVAGPRKRQPCPPGALLLVFLAMPEILCCTQGDEFSYNKTSALHGHVWRQGSWPHTASETLFPSCGSSSAFQELLRTSTNCSEGT